MNGEQELQRDAKLTDELRAIAQMATVQDIAGAWLKFCGHYAGKWLHVAGSWQKWCVGEAKRERTERDRARQNGSGSPQDASTAREQAMADERAFLARQRQERAGAGQPPKPLQEMLAEARLAKGAK